MFNKKFSALHNANRKRSQTTQSCKKQQQHQQQQQVEFAIDI